MNGQHFTLTPEPVRDAGAALLVRDSACRPPGLRTIAFWLGNRGALVIRPPPCAQRKVRSSL